MLQKSELAAKPTFYIIRKSFTGRTWIDEVSKTLFYALELGGLKSFFGIARQMALIMR